MVLVLRARGYAIGIEFECFFFYVFSLYIGLMYVIKYIYFSNLLNINIFFYDDLL